jgi:hypothetical protein
MHLSASYGWPYSAWRRADGNADPGQADVVAIGTYTGNGAGARTITCSPASTKRPLFVHVQPEAGPGIYRDASHTGTTSTTDTGLDVAANGITAGDVNSFSVASALNTNLVVYNYFVLWGSATAGSGVGGFSALGEFVPVEANSPADGPWPADPSEAVILATAASEEEEEAAAAGDDLTTDIAATCVNASTRLVNLALQRIGITARLSNLGTDATQEADAARVCYKTEIDATLRDFPWRFATRYADLVLVAGVDTEDPVNGDWTFAYRTPTDCVFVRRVVNPDTKRGYDRLPIAFQPGSDEDGDLIYCDEPGVLIPSADPVSIEYTHRPDCPASRGDAIFRSAAAWRLGGALAKALGRDSKDADRCLRNYLIELRRAEMQAANEQEPQENNAGNDADWIQGR